MWVAVQVLLLPCTAVDTSNAIAILGKLPSFKERPPVIIFLKWKCVSALRTVPAAAVATPADVDPFI